MTKADFLKQIKEFSDKGEKLKAIKFVKDIIGSLQQAYIQVNEVSFNRKEESKADGVLFIDGKLLYKNLSREHRFMMKKYRTPYPLHRDSLMLKYVKLSNKKKLEHCFNALHKLTTRECVEELLIGELGYVRDNNSDDANHFVKRK